MSAFEPRTVRDAATIIGLFAREIAAGAVASERLLLMDQPDLFDGVILVELLLDRGDREGAWQLLQAISVIVVAGGWQAVVADPDASRAWARVRRA